MTVAARIERELLKVLNVDTSVSLGPWNPISKLTGRMYVSDEMLIDTGLATPEVIARDAARRAEAKARWNALPLWTRFARCHVWPLRYEARHRLSHALAALRGIDCERDW